MGRVRPFAPDDISPVVDIFRDCFAGIARRPRREVATKFRQVFLDGPLARGPQQSLVHEDAGEVTGFMGVLSVPHRLGERKLTGACVMELMMCPRRPNARGAMRLVRAALDQGQDFTFANKAAAKVHPIWRRFGGVRCWAYGFHWRLVLQPASFALARAQSTLRGRRAWLRPALHWVRPAARFVDEARGSRANPSNERTPLRCEAATAERLRHAARETVSAPLYYDFEHPATEWLLSYYDDYPSRGAFCCRVAVDDAQRPQGLFAFLAGPDGVHEVLSLHARESHWPAVIESLKRESARRGGVQLVGQTCARGIRPLAAAGAELVPRDAAFFLISKDDEVRHHFLTGDAFGLGLEDEKVF